MDILFTIDEQTLARVSESAHPATGSKNYLKACFEFNTSDWAGLVKVALFKDEQGKEFLKYLGRGAYGECFVPFGVLKGDYFTVSVYAGDVITTNEVIVTLVRSSYDKCRSGQQDVFVDIFEELDNKVNIQDYQCEVEDIHVELDTKLNISDFDDSFDVRMRLWCQNIADAINQL